MYSEPKCAFRALMASILQLWLFWRGPALHVWGAGWPVWMASLRAFREDRCEALDGCDSLSWNRERVGAKAFGL